MFEIRPALFGICQFLLCRRVLRVAGIMTEQKLRFIIHAVAVAVLASDHFEALRDVLFSSLRDKLFSEEAQPRPKWIVRKLIEALGIFVLAWKMTGSTTGQAFGEEPIVMLFEADFVGWSAASLPDATEHSTHDRCATPDKRN